MTLQRFYRIAADNAQARNGGDWDYFWHCMERIYAWQDWMSRKRSGKPAARSDCLYPHCSCEVSCEI